MPGTTMSFALPENLRAYIDERVRNGPFGNTSEYLRDLVRRDQQEQAKARIRALIEDGLTSGPGVTVTDELLEDVRSRALQVPG